MRTERRADPFGVLALAAAGTLTAHEIGYITDGDASSSAHAYFGLLGPAVLLAVCLAGWISATRIVRRDPGRAPSFALLAGLQIAGYVVMEGAEQLTSGASPAPASLPVLFGLALQPLVAWAALRLLSTGERIIRALFVDALPSVPSRCIVAETPVTAVIGTLLPSRLRVRGPPAG